MGVQRQRRVYEKWSQGPTGSGNDDAGDYNSVNAQVYENGTLGPRPGWKKLTVANGTKGHDAANDELAGCLWFRDTDDDDRFALFYRDDSDSDNLKYDVFALASPTWSAGGNTISAQGDTASIHPPGYATTSRHKKVDVWNDGFVLSGIGPYLSVATTNGIGAPTKPTIADGNPASVTRYRERAYYWGFANKPGRIYYSDPADYATVGATSFFDVNLDVDSIAGAVTGVWAVANSLLIARRDDSWLVLTGTSPENGTLREIGRDITPDFLSGAVFDGQVFFLNRSAQGIVVASPSSVDANSLRHLSPTAYPGSPFERPDDSVFPAQAVADDVSQNMLLMFEDDWSLGVEYVNGVFTLSEWKRSDPVVADTVFSRGRPGILWAVVHNTSATPDTFDVITRDFTLNRPARGSDTYSSPLSEEYGNFQGSARCLVRLSPVRGAAGSVVRPVRIVLDIDDYQDQLAPDDEPTLAIEIQLEGVEYQNADHDLQADTTININPDLTSLPGTGVNRRRLTYHIDQAAWATRFYVDLEFDGMALDTVIVDYEELQDP